MHLDKQTTKQSPTKSSSDPTDPNLLNIPGQSQPTAASSAPSSPPPSQPPQVINIQTPPQASPPPTQTTYYQHPSSVTSTPIKISTILGNQRAMLSHKLGILSGIIFGTIETSLTFRLFFKLFAANPDNRFVSSLYRFTDVFVDPFVGIFNINLGFENFILDLPTILAMIIYSLIGYGIWWLTRLF